MNWTIQNRKRTQTDQAASLIKETQHSVFELQFDVLGEACCLQVADNLASSHLCSFFNISDSPPLAMRSPPLYFERKKLQDLTIRSFVMKVSLSTLASEKGLSES